MTEKVNKVHPETTEKTCDQMVDGFFNRMFSNWGGKVARNPCKVFWISFLFFILLASGMARSASFDDESIVWTPSGNPSIIANERQKAMFPTSGGFVGALFEVKGDTENILTKAAFEEMKNF